MSARSILGLRRRAAVALMTALLGCLLAGASCARKPPPRVQALPPAKPWFKAKNISFFPLAEGKIPNSAQELAAAMVRGWQGRLNLPAAGGHQLVRVEAHRYPVIERLLIDLSDAAVPTKEEERRRGSKPPKLEPAGGPVGSLTVKAFEFRADPLRVRGAGLHVFVSASDVRLDVSRDKQGRPMLALVEAGDGTLRLRISRADMESLLLSTAREEARKHALRVLSSRLVLRVADDGRGVEADWKVNALVGIIPAGLRFRGRMDIDDQLNARLSNLSCSGDQILGPIISLFVGPQLRKYEGKQRPIVAFLSPEMRLRDVKIRLDDALHIKAAFGRGNAAGGGTVAAAGGGADHTPSATNGAASP